MDFETLNNDRKIASSAEKIERYIDKGFSSKAKKTVTNYSIVGGIAFALPLFGLDNIIYAITLWSMYVSLCSLAKQSFGSNLAKSFIGAFIVNLIVSSIIEVIVACIPGAGIIGAFVIGFFSIKISGAAYLKALEIAHRGNVAERYKINR